MNNLEILEIGKDTYKDNVNVQTSALIKNKLYSLLPHIELNTIRTIQLSGIA